MARVTKADLEQLVEVIAGEGYFIEYASGWPRLFLEIDGGAIEEVSPRLPAREMQEWLNGFIKGLAERPCEIEEEEENPEVASPVSSKGFPWAVAVATIGGYRTWAAFPTEAEANRHADYLADKLKWDVEVFNDYD